jgi:23S rRNA pseudouridine2604 synthase
MKPPRPPGRGAAAAPPTTPPPPPARAPDDGSLRLSKRMSELGLASRREADEWIARGWVRVDGAVVSELGSRVLPEQRITIDPRARNAQAQLVTVLLNKPVGYVSGQAEDGYRPARVLVTPDRQWREDRSGIRFQPQHLKSLVPAGRLDIDSVGLLVLTQDGRVARQLIGEDSEVEKEYLVRVAAPAGAPLSPQGLALLRHGLELDGQALRPARVEWANADQLRFVLIEGRKRQIRRMCEAVGLQVLGLKRVRIGAIALGALPAGQWRYLRADERFVAPAAR